MKQTWHGAASVAVAVVSFACTGTVDGTPGAPGMGSGAASSGGTSAATGGGSSGGSANAGGTVASGGKSSGGTNSGGSGNGTASGGASGSAGSSGTSGAGGTSTDPGAPAYLPAGVRRLTNQEYVASVTALLGGNATLPADFAFPPDSRQNGFTRNQAQRVDPVLVKQLDTNAQAIADSARPAFSKLAPCSGTTAQAKDACAATFIASFGESAYRRPLDADEKAGLQDLYTAGVTGGSYEDGIALVIRAVLQAPGFIYVTELGDGKAASGTDFELTPREIATSLAFYMTAAPPSQALLDDADSGMVTVGAGDGDFGITDPAGTAFVFGTPEAMSVWARRMLYSRTSTGAQTAVVRMVKEWLGVDAITQTGKDTTVYGHWNDAYRTSLDTQTLSFVRALAGGEYGVAELLGADWTMVNPTLAGSDYYGISGSGPADQDGFYKVTVPGYRRGILNQGAFLSVFAHASESAPVLRGAAVLRRVLCIDPGSPADLSGVTPPAPPNATQTTRERYAEHATNSKCAGCHAPIDAIGFSFEDFDGAGNYQTSEPNGRQVDPSTDVPTDMNMGISGTFANSGELAAALAASPSVVSCFARQLFRNAAARSGDAVQPSEDSFVAEWRANPDAATGRITSSVLAYATSPILSHRRAP
jgi:hypothetical protein